MLNGTVERIEDLTLSDIDRMFELITAYFDGYTRENFEQDLTKKHEAITFRTDRIEGFTTIEYLEETVRGQPIEAIFSGDTIMERAYRGKNDLTRVWTRTMLERAAETNRPFYWFLISSGPDTYGLLPLHFERFYPNHVGAPPERERSILEALATSKFGEQFDPQSGLITFTHSQERLKPEHAIIGERRLKNPHLRYFVEEANPTYAAGTELACLAEVSEENFRTRFLERLLR